MKAIEIIHFLFVFIILNVNCQVYKSSNYNSYENGLHHRKGSVGKSQFVHELDQLLDIDQRTTRPSFIPMRNKKYRYTPEPPTCMAKFKYERNVIVDSKASIRNGAELLSPIRYISKNEASSSLNALQDKCMKLCCDSEKCDTALLSMKIGQDGYRCYLFKCNGNCFFVKHNEYVVLRMRSSEQLTDQDLPDDLIKSTTKLVPSVTKQAALPNNFNSEMMGGSMTNQHETNSNNFVPSDLNEKQKIQFVNKSNSVTSKSNVSLAVFFLIAGISIVILLFSYLFLSTKFVKKRLGALKNGTKNVDVDGDGDYLINGMYL